MDYVASVHWISFFGMICNKNADFLGIKEEGMKENIGGGEFKYHIFDTL
jgi:hypothetical protein